MAQRILLEGPQEGPEDVDSVTGDLVQGSSVVFEPTDHGRSHFQSVAAAGPPFLDFLGRDPGFGLGTGCLSAEDVENALEMILLGFGQFAC